MQILKRSMVLALPALLLPAVAFSQMEKPGAYKHAVVTPDKLTWEAIQPPGFDAGAKIAAIHGDPNAETGVYVIRLMFPDGYKFPPHWHPNAENLTVLEGDFMLGMGEMADAAKLVTYKPGSFLFIPGKSPHFGQVKGNTVIQLHGQAPFKIELVAAKP